MRLPKLDSYHLIVFYFVAKEKSITLAANDLCLTQPTVTRHIKSLESATNLKLIEVNKQKVSLTPSGEALYEYAKEIFHQTANAERFVELSTSSSLKIGASAFLNTILAPVLKKMYYDHPSTKISFENSCTLDLIRGVWHSKIDLAIVPKLDYGELKLNYVKIADGLRMVFYASPTNRIFEKSPIGWKDLGEYPLLMGAEDSASKQIVLNKLKSEGLEQSFRLGPTIIHDVGLRKRLVEDGEFISLTLINNIEDELHSRKFRIITLSDDIFIEVGVFMRENIVVPPIIQKTITLTREIFKSSVNKLKYQDVIW